MDTAACTLFSSQIDSPSAASAREQNLLIKWHSWIACIWPNPSYTWLWKLCPACDLIPTVKCAWPNNSDFCTPLCDARTDQIHGMGPVQLHTGQLLFVTLVYQFYLFWQSSCRIIFQLSGCSGSGVILSWVIHLHLISQTESHPFLILNSIYDCRYIFSQV